MHTIHFYISPHSFSQANTQQAELLYEQAVMAEQDYYTSAQAVQLDDAGSTAAGVTAGAAGDQHGSSSGSVPPAPSAVYSARKTAVTMP